MLQAQVQADLMQILSPHLSRACVCAVHWLILLLLMPHPPRLWLRLMSPPQGLKKNWTKLVLRLSAMEKLVFMMVAEKSCLLLLGLSSSRPTRTLSNVIGILIVVSMLLLKMLLMPYMVARLLLVMLLTVCVLSVIVGFVESRSHESKVPKS